MKKNNAKNSKTTNKRSKQVTNKASRTTNAKSARNSKENIGFESDKRSSESKNCK